MKEGTKKVASVVIVIFVAYLVLAMVGVLPAEYNIGKRMFPTSALGSQYKNFTIQDKVPIGGGFEVDPIHHQIYMGTKDALVDEYQITITSYDGDPINVIEDKRTWQYSTDLNNIYVAEHGLQSYGKIPTATNALSEIPVTGLPVDYHIGIDTLNGIVFIMDFQHIYKIEDNKVTKQIDTTIKSFQSIKVDKYRDLLYVGGTDGYFWEFDLNLDLKYYFDTASNRPITGIAISELNRLVYFCTDVGDLYVYDRDTPNYAIIKTDSAGMSTLECDYDGGIWWCTINGNDVKYYNPIENSEVSMTLFDWIPVNLAFSNYTGEMFVLYNAQDRIEVWDWYGGDKVPISELYGNTEITIVKAGENYYGKVGEQTEIIVNVKNQFGIDSVTLYWKDVASDGDYNAIVMGFTQGSSVDGDYSATIGAINNATTIRFYVSVLTVIGEQVQSNAHDIAIQSEIPPQGVVAGIPFYQIFNGIAVLLLIAVGIAINRPQTSGWRKSK